MIVLPISAAGGLSYLFNGHLDLWIFVQTLLGLSIGAYVGAKFTHLAPKAPAQSGYRRHADLGRHHHGPLWPLSLLMAVPEVTDQDGQDNPEKQPPAVLADMDKVMP